MTDFSDLFKADNDQPARSIHLLDSNEFEAWLNGQPERIRTLVGAQKFRGKANEHAVLPAQGDDDWSVVAGVADREKLGTWCLAKLAEVLPEGHYRLSEGSPGAAALGWMAAQYRFGRYRKEDNPVGARILLTKDVARIDAMVHLAQAVALVRDLVNTPAADMGPPQLENAASEVAERFGAAFTVTKGDELEQGYPMIHAVGKAADKSFAPRLIELHWGDPKNPRIAIVGKGICFDSGGLDIKPASAMAWMKKDMGGAAHALALAQLVMGARLPVRLHLLIPAAENAVGGNAFRPGDILKSRKGISVEIGNTDAEGRLVLGDALTRAGEDKPELIIDYATLTGAARVAVGPDLPALFTNDDDLAAAVSAAGAKVDDPSWRLPLWDGYADMLKSDVADINNAGEGGFAGAITAALFLRRFVPDDTSWLHLDTFAWRPSARPGRPKGGEALGLRAIFRVLQQRYGRPD
ncbi:leucyl aminopeptidase [Sphingobium wenxiniae]|uniref:Cytosol aminopeptidase n=2 Tax=Sphingobium TaxID=165695 RepID=T0H009_9SPHN|nr:MULTISPECIES: leucyl aminopeptidase family protein [Sphingobium]EQB06307.1 cytosol aminopeptidase [Sphingobium baderi LL03]KMS62448.1 cytosol aminopeptidase [Sphingobium baderi LL03]MBB6190744.1 leucyl aminopeptidase [Sphingobium wenxiniae]TWH94522.1 leucyl aminopeptidase [Sphingobium wenxiniae]WRD76787.1 leucyl aminopeptidase family protein [Sphingobium baderi]